MIEKLNLNLEKNKNNKEKEIIINNSKSETKEIREEINKDIKILNKIDNNFEIMYSLLNLEEKNFNIEDFRKNLKLFEDFLKINENIIKKHPKKQNEFEKKIKNLKEFNDMYTFLENEKEKVLIPKDKDTKKEILLIWQTHNIKLTHWDDLEIFNKVTKSQKLIHIYLKYFQKNLNQIWLENKDNSLNNNSILSLAINDLFFKVWFYDIEGNLKKEIKNYDNIIKELKIREENKHKTKTRYLLWKELDWFSIEQDYLLEILEKQSWKNIEDLLIFQWFENWLIFTENNKNFIWLENELDNDIQKRDDYENKLWDHILEKYPKEDDTNDIFNYFSNNIYNIFWKWTEKDKKNFIDNFLNKYDKLDKNKAKEIIESIFYYWYTKREDYVLENIEKNFSKEKETIPLVYWSSHIKTFEERIKVWNKKNPDKKYSYKVIDLSKF